MKNERLTEEIKERIWTMKKEGLRVHEIADALGLSQSGVYRVIQMKRVKEDNDINRPLSYNDRYEEKIATLEAKIRSLEETNDRLLRIIEKLTVGN
jgi:predicted transcriptional regulator